MEKYIWNFNFTNEGFSVEVTDTESKKKYIAFLSGIKFAFTDEQISDAKKEAEKNGVFLSYEEIKKEFESQSLESLDTQQLLFNFIKNQIDKKNYSLSFLDNHIICSLNNINVGITIDEDDEINFPGISSFTLELCS
jgi:hypothetical protein